MKKYVRVVCKIQFCFYNEQCVVSVVIRYKYRRDK